MTQHEEIALISDSDDYGEEDDSPRNYIKCFEVECYMGNDEPKEIENIEHQPSSPTVITAATKPAKN